MKPVITIFDSIHQSGIDKMSEFSDVNIAYGVDRKKCLELSSASNVIVVKSGVEVDKELLNNSPYLSIIARAGTGVDNIDTVEAKRLGIKVLTVPTGNSISAAEFTLLQILILCRRIPEVTDFINKNDYRRQLLEGRELCNMSVGLVGLGNVGMLVFERLKAFGCIIFGYDPYSNNISQFMSSGGIHCKTFDELLSNVDIISFHARLTKDNIYMMGDEQFNKVKPGVLIINTSRANLINQKSLLKSVKNGVVSAVSLDVLEPEPPFELDPSVHNYQHPLLNNSKIYITPHIGASTLDAQKRISLEICKKILDNWSKYDE
jgi:D-3-phosphoglycerate dehydrogenase / 2-oxoglutarate reductase